MISLESISLHYISSKFPIIKNLFDKWSPTQNFYIIFFQYKLNWCNQRLSWRPGVRLVTWRSPIDIRATSRSRPTSRSRRWFILNVWPRGRLWSVSRNLFEHFIELYWSHWIGFWFLMCHCSLPNLEVEKPPAVQCWFKVHLVLEFSESWRFIINGSA